MTTELFSVHGAVELAPSKTTVSPAPGTPEGLQLALEPHSPPGPDIHVYIPALTAVDILQMVRIILLTLGFI